jgi:hypothetical protein
MIGWEVDIGFAIRGALTWQDYLLDWVDEGKTLELSGRIFILIRDINNY